MATCSEWDSGFPGRMRFASFTLLWLLAAAARYISRVQALLDSVHIDINNEGVNEEDIGMEVQMDEEEAAMKAADEMIEGFWRD